MPAPEPARKSRSDGLETRARLLDAAERLFAERGYHGSSVRDITSAAGLRLASVNYHFASKEELFRGVVRRRAEPLAADRLLLLGAVPLRGGRRARLEAIARAFSEPLAARAREDSGFRAYYTLIAQVAHSRLDVLAPLARDFNLVARRFIAALHALYPEASPSRLRHAYQSMLAATLYAFSANRRLDSLSRGTQRSDDFERVLAELVPFVVGGLAHSLKRA